MNAKKWWIRQFLTLSVFLYAVLTLVVFFYPNLVLTVLVAWLASPILFLVIAFVCERDVNGRGATVGQVFKSVFSLKTQAWSFIFGDLLFLPFALAVAANNWYETNNRVDFSLWWWWFLSLLIGVATGFGWHASEKKGYESSGFGDNLNSPTKLFHDFVSYPVLFGGIVFAFVPMLFHIQWDFIADLPVVLVILSLVAWAGLGVADTLRAKTCSPWGHPKYDLKNDVCLAHA